jgi:hypothetical protein
MFTDRLQNMLQHPGLDDATVNKMVNRGNDSLAENENSAALALQEKASASGFGASGAQPHASRALGAQRTCAAARLRALCSARGGGAGAV